MKTSSLASLLFRSTLTLAWLALGASACMEEDEEKEPSGQDHANPDHGGNEETVTLGFKGMVGAEPFSCESAYTLGSSGSSATFSDFKLYLSEVTLIRKGGERVAAVIPDQEAWQARGVALLDFEDGTGRCANGSPATRTRIELEAPAHQDYVGVEATLGVPFELNHEDVGALPSPLNLQSMFWSWQGGRKFLRIDGQVDGVGGLRYHLGSLGCQGMQGDITACTKPNRGRFRVEGEDPTSHLIAIDLKPLFEGLDLTPREGRSVLCMSGPDTPSCTLIFAASGVDYQSGEPAMSEQAMFKLTSERFDAKMNPDQGGDTSGSHEDDHGGDHEGHRGHGG